MKLHTLVKTLDSLLCISEITDYSGAVNGLQIENSGHITRLIAAVDACEWVISKAARVKGTLLLVHHGLFWQGVQPIAGSFYRKLKVALDGDLALYSSHLPLDFHSELGNNVLLARALGLTGVKPALSIKGELAGVMGKTRAIHRDEFAQKISLAVGGSVRLAPGGGEKIRTVLIVTGGAGSEVSAAAKLGVDAFVTGEGPHWSYTMAEEERVNLFYAGHYATETFGVKALASYLSKQTGLSWNFLDHPTGL